MPAADAHERTAWRRYARMLCASSKSVSGSAKASDPSRRLPGGAFPKFNWDRYFIESCSRTFRSSKDSDITGREVSREKPDYPGNLKGQPNEVTTKAVQ